MQSPVDEEFHLCNVAYWPIASVRCAATIRPESGVKPTCHGRRSIDAIDPFRKSVRRKAIAQAARSSLTSRPAFGGQFELENRALPSSV